jgi:hypothetical protein
MSENPSNMSSAVSAISLYARPGTSGTSQLSAMFAMLDTENTVPASLLDLLAAADTNAETQTETTAESSGWSVHAPESRTVFQELKGKFKDLDAIYNGCKHTDGVDAISDTETLENAEQLNKNIDFFKERITENFSKYVFYEQQCEREVAFLTQCMSILELIEAPPLEDNNFNDCASSICNSMTNFTSLMSDNISVNRSKRDMFWNQYKGYRNACKLIDTVQSDIICTICMNDEVSVALACGHAFCQTCASRSHNCPNCREPAGKRLKLFF